MKSYQTQKSCDASWTREALAFHRAMASVKSTQEMVLGRILRDNSATEYGKRFGFAKIASSEEFRQSVPLIDYAAIGSYVERIAAGERNILFRGKPLALQPTSGTTSGSKMIPFTADLRKQFQRGAAAWLYDLWTQLPAMSAGKSYWSISPVVREQKLTSGGTPVGFLDDTEYLTPSMASVLTKTLAVPSALGLVTDTELFRYLTMAFLLKTRDLVFISVWNPTFFLLLLDSLRDNFPGIVADIERGELPRIKTLPDSLREPIAAAFGDADPKRAAELRATPTHDADTGTAPYARIWPELRLVSCWEDAAARGPAARLRELFPGVRLQPKGLIATEAMISVPLFDAEYPLLSLRSHFFEFMPTGKGSETLRAWELETGAHYEVVVTTSGGLYRYRLGDIVKVRGHYNDCPMLEFMGRGNHTSDIYGEKLHQSHVTEMIDEAFRERRSSSWFALLAPDGDGKVDRYTLFVAFDCPVEEAWLAELGIRLEKNLRSNFHYDYCRRLGQLKELEVCPVGLDVTGASRKYMEEMKRRGLREGDIKPALLDNRPLWKRVFGVMEG